MRNWKNSLERTVTRKKGKMTEFKKIYNREIVLLFFFRNLMLQIVAEEGFNMIATMNPGGDYGKKEVRLLKNYGKKVSRDGVRGNVLKIFVKQADLILRSDLWRAKLYQECWDFTNHSYSALFYSNWTFMYINKTFCWIACEWNCRNNQVMTKWSNRFSSQKLSGTASRKCGLLPTSMSPSWSESFYSISARSTVTPSLQNIHSRRWLPAPLCNGSNSLLRSSRMSFGRYRVIKCSILKNWKPFFVRNYLSNYI